MIPAPGSERSGLLDQTLAAVLESGEIIRRGLHAPKNVRNKGAIDLVTDTDLAVERFLKERLAGILPGSDFLAEETAKATVPGRLTWIIDPLDGTTNFAHGLPFVATSVALWQGGRVVLGVVNAPALGEVFTATLGGGAFRNGEPMAVSDRTDLRQCLAATGFPYASHLHMPVILRQAEAVLRATRGLRRPGAAAIDLAYLAAGRYDFFYEIGLNPWDTAAGWLLIEEAGGRVTTFDPSEPYRFGAPHILASNGAVHEAAAALLA